NLAPGCSCAMEAEGAGADALVWGDAGAAEAALLSRLAVRYWSRVPAPRKSSVATRTLTIQVGAAARLRAGRRFKLWFSVKFRSCGGRQGPASVGVCGPAKSVANVALAGASGAKTSFGERNHCWAGGAGAVTISAGAHNSNAAGCSSKDAW